MSWKDHLKLNDGDSVEFVETRSGGNLGQKETHKYNIVNKNGVNIGSVVHKENTSIKAPFRNKNSLAQYDAVGNEVHAESWDD